MNRKRSQSDATAAPGGDLFASPAAAPAWPTASRRKAAW